MQETSTTSRRTFKNAVCSVLTAGLSSHEQQQPTILYRRREVEVEMWNIHHCKAKSARRLAQPYGKTRYPNKEDAGALLLTTCVSATKQQNTHALTLPSGTTKPPVPAEAPVASPAVAVSPLTEAAGVGAAVPLVEG